VPPRTATRHPPALRRHDTIEDPGEESSQIAAEHITRFLTEPVESQSDLDAQFDILFPPTPDRSKRRRISPSQSNDRSRHERHESAIEVEPISSSSPKPPSPTADRDHRELWSPFSRPANRTRATETPVPARQQVSLQAETPRHPSSSVKTPFRSHPRFVLPASTRSSDHLSTPSTGETPGPSQPRRRPNFILPRTPSPEGGQPNSNDPSSPPPAAFSPTSHALHRRGRSRSISSNYFAGGVAAEVRGWILDIGMKREQQVSRFSWRVRVDSCRLGMLGSGPVIVTRAHALEPFDDVQHLQSDMAASPKNILLLGARVSQRRDQATQSILNNNSSHGHSPTTPSRPLPSTLSIKPGDVIGIHRGLTWEIELEARANIDPVRTEERPAEIPESPDACDDQEISITEEQLDSEPKMETWLVAAEWDRLVQA
jgi:hypothetical protein